MYAGILRLGLRENNVTTSGLSRLPLVRGVGSWTWSPTPPWCVTWMQRHFLQLINHFEQSCLDVIAPWAAALLRPSVTKFSSSPKPRTLSQKLACSCPKNRC